MYHLDILLGSLNVIWPHYIWMQISEFIRPCEYFAFTVVQETKLRADPYVK